MADGRFTQCKAIHIWGLEGTAARQALKGNNTEISGLGDSGMAGTDSALLLLHCSTLRSCFLFSFSREIVRLVDDGGQDVRVSVLEAAREDIVQRNLGWN